MSFGENSMTRSDALEFMKLDKEDKLCPCGFRHFKFEEHIAACCKGDCPSGNEFADYKEICMMDPGCPIEKVGKAGCERAKRNSK